MGKDRICYFTGGDCYIDQQERLIKDTEEGLQEADRYTSRLEGQNLKDAREQIAQDASNLAQVRIDLAEFRTSFSEYCDKCPLGKRQA